MAIFRILATYIAVIIGNTVLAQNSGYHLVNVFSIDGPGRWDYIALNPVNDNVYVSHTNCVNILNRNTGDSVGCISNTDGVHGIAFAPEFNKGFTSNGRSNTVTVFDINSNEIITHIKTGENPDAIMYDPYSKMVYVCDGHSKTLSVIDPYTNKVAKTIELGGRPETAVSNEAGKIFVNIEDRNEIVVVNTTTYAVEQHWNIGKGEEPSGLAIDRRTKRLFIGCGNKLMVILNAENGSVVKELPIGEGCDGVAFDPATRHIFSANGDGTLTVIRERSAENFMVIDNVPTKKGARTLVVDDKVHKIYLPVADYTSGDTKNVIPGTFKILVVGI